MKVISNKKSEDLVNDLIRFKEMMVIGPQGEQLGILMRREALAKAEEYDLDLLCVAPNAQPPVCKILDYGRYRFEASKKAKEAKKKQHVTEVKPLRLSPVIDVGDFETKLSQAKKWLLAGKKVRIDMRFRGRLITRVEVGNKTMNEFINRLSDISVVESAPKLEGNSMSATLNYLKNKVKEKDKEKEKEGE